MKKIIYKRRIVDIFQFIFGLVFCSFIPFVFKLQSNVYFFSFFSIVVFSFTLIKGMKIFDKNTKYLRPGSNEFHLFFNDYGEFNYFDNGFSFKQEFFPWNSIVDISIVAINPGDYFYESIEIEISTNTNKIHYSIEDKGIYMFYEKIREQYKDLTDSLRTETHLSFRIKNFQYMKWNKLS